MLTFIEEIQMANKYIKLAEWMQFMCMFHNRHCSAISKSHYMPYFLKRYFSINIYVTPIKQVGMVKT
jgi:hypothetical protein